MQPTDDQRKSSGQQLVQSYKAEALQDWARAGTGESSCARGETVEGPGKGQNTSRGRDRVEERLGG